MSTPLKGLRTTIYYVSDLERAKEWYARAFGQEPYFDEPFYVGFEIGGYELGLHPGEKKKAETESVISYWGVDDIQKEFKRLMDLGGKSHQEPMNVGDNIMVASVRDPWNNIVGIIYNPNFRVKSSQAG
ncbi:MAG TPA: VOC family protein [Cyclobacteriaceae bacterium]|jgi:lactoylglutathione lyase